MRDLKVSPMGLLQKLEAGQDEPGREALKKLFYNPLPSSFSTWSRLYEKRGDRWYRIGNVSNFKE